MPNVDRLPNALSLLGQAGATEVERLQKACNDIVRELGGNLKDSSKAGVREAAVKGGAMDLIAGAMARHPGAFELQRDGCEALRYVMHFDVGPTARSQFSNQGIAAVIAAMQEHADRTDVQQCAFGTLLAATTGAGVEGLQKAIVAAGVFPLIIAAMRTHAHDESLLELALQAVGSIAYQSSPNKTAFANCDGFVGVVAGLRAHPQNVRLLVLGLQTVAGLVISPTIQEKLAVAGIVDVLVTAMQQHTANVQLQATACETVQNMVANNLANKELVGQRGGIGTIVAAMSTHLASAGVQESACRALRTICSNEGTNQQKLSVAGGYSAIVATMDAHATNGQVQLAAVRCLLAAVANQPRLQQQAAPLVEAKVRRAQKAFPAIKELQKEATELLAMLKKKGGCAVQ